MNELLSEFEKYCGVERYQKFVSTLASQSKQSKRLMFWQEELLRDFSAHSGKNFPQNLADVLALYCHAPIKVAISSAASSGCLVVNPVFREFRSMNQMASGGSYLTVFTVIISPNPEPDFIHIRDMAGPHERPEVARDLLKAMAEGVDGFFQNRLKAGEPILGIIVELQHYEDHLSDMKPWKYAPAISFILEDILREAKFDKVLPVKLAGIPL